MKGHAVFAARRDIFLSIAAVIGGALIAWVDTRPNWDDTGITAGLLILAAGSAAVAGLRPWQAATLVAGPLIVAEWRNLGLGLLIVLALTLAGACVGALIRRALAGASR